MTKTAWKRKIKDAAESAGTYRPYFDAVIDTLADILEKRDSAAEQYTESGAQPIIERPDTNGVMKSVRNPALQCVMDLNTQALAYWRDLGLTPSGLKKINAEQLNEQPKSGFVELLGKIGA